MDESLGFDPNNSHGEYDRSKAAASLEVQRAALVDLDAVIVCPTGVIGPYDFRGSEMGEVIRGAAEAHTMFYVEGPYDSVDVRDVAAGHGRRGESYILGGNKISMRYMLETVREVTGKTFCQHQNPALAGPICGQVYTLVLPKNEDQAALYALLTGSVTEQLGYQP
jgi:dihydroflavonol-4-reductase